MLQLGKLPVLGRPTNLDNGRARAFCACSRCGGSCLDIFIPIVLEKKRRGIVIALAFRREFR